MTQFAPSSLPRVVDKLLSEKTEIELNMFEHLHLTCTVTSSSSYLCFYVASIVVTSLLFMNTQHSDQLLLFSNYY